MTKYVCYSIMVTLSDTSSFVQASMTYDAYAVCVYGHEYI